MARLVDLAAEGDMAADLVRAKLADLEAERVRLLAELAQASALVPEPGEIADAIHRALREVWEMLRGDRQGAREALRAFLGGEPLRVVSDGSGYRLEGAVDLIPAAPAAGPSVVQVAGARNARVSLPIPLPVSGCVPAAA